MVAGESVWESSLREGRGVGFGMWLASLHGSRYCEPVRAKQSSAELADECVLRGGGQTPFGGQNRMAVLPLSGAPVARRTRGSIKRICPDWGVAE
jgi:hypothetical protein